MKKTKPKKISYWRNKADRCLQECTCQFELLTKFIPKNGALHSKNCLLNKLK